MFLIIKLYDKHNDPKLKIKIYGEMFITSFFVFFTECVKKTKKVHKKPEVLS